MTVQKTPADPRRQAQIAAELQRDRDLRQAGYRDQALKLLPHICARCGREFSGKRLRELTVHHKDCNYKNNPPDGRNWELLCLYCHDNEHAAFSHRVGGEGSMAVGESTTSAIANPFAGLDSLVTPKEEK